MKKFFSLIKACMSTDMSIIKIGGKKNKKSSFWLPLFISLYLMFMIWGLSNSMFEKLADLNLSYLLLSLLVFSVSFMTFVEGIYKSGALIFNCKDDDLLLSLPIKKRDVLLVRIFKFYVFELLFNSLFMLPVMIAYIRWAPHLEWTYFLTSLVMLLFLPIIPIILSCLLGAFISSLASRFKYKNAVQIVISMAVLVCIFALSFNSNKAFDYIAQHSSSLNDIITKIYYPVWAYSKLINEFHVLDLISFIVIHLLAIILFMTVLSKFYFKINSRLKSVVTTRKKRNLRELSVKSKSQISSIIHKELVTFFKTPVFIINAGFALLLFLILVLVITFNFDTFMSMLSSEASGLMLSKEFILDNASIYIFVLVSITAYMTSITNSVISLEGKNILIIKSFPIDAKKLLLGKVLASLVITTPILFMGDLVLFFVAHINIFEALLLLILSVLVPLVSHFIGIIINLKYPKLDWDNSSEVVKQSTSSFIAVLIGMILLFVTVFIVMNLVGNMNSLLLLVLATIIYFGIDSLLYFYLTTKSVIDFNNLEV